MQPEASTRPLLLGHRGCRGAFPENSFAAFDYALASGCDGFEFDVRATSDAELVLHHDPRLLGRRLAKHTYAKLHERRRWPRRAEVEAPLAYLHEMLARYHERAWLDIELKVGGTERSVVELLKKYPPAKGFVVSSFLPEVIDSVHELDASVPLGLIFKATNDRNRWRTVPVEYVMPQHRILTAAAMREYRAAGKKVVTWTVNDGDEMQRVRALGVDGIIADDPIQLCSTIR